MTIIDFSARLESRPAPPFEHMWLALTLRVIDNGKEDTLCHRVRIPRDDFTSLWDIIWKDAKQQIDLAIEKRQGAL